MSDEYGDATALDLPQERRTWFVAAIESGDRRRALEALRLKLALAVEACDPEKIAPPATRLQAVLDAIAALPDAKEQSTSDDLAARRKARRSAAQAVEPAAGGVVE